MNTVLITVLIEQEGSRTIEFPVEGIQINNLKDKYELSFENSEVVELKFVGEQEKLDQLDITNAVSIDLQSCKEAGEYELQVSVEVPEGIQLVRQPKVKVKLTEKKETSVPNTDSEPKDEKEIE